MKGNLVTYVLRLSLTLLLITAFVAAALAGVNAVADPLIQAHKAEKMQKAMEEVLPGATGLAEVSFTDATGTVNKVYACADGYVVDGAPAGFGGAISMMGGILPDGSVKGISSVSHT